MKTTFDVTYRHDPESKAVRFNHGKPWLEEDMALLRDHFLKGASLAELCCVCQRGASGIISRMEQMKLIQGSWTDDYYNVLVRPPTKGEPVVATETDDEYLWREYVLTIQNEGEWYRKTRDDVEGKHYLGYSNATAAYVRRIAARLQDADPLEGPTTSACRAITALVRRVVLTLWHSEDGIEPEGHGYGTTYRTHVEYLKKNVFVPGLSTANANPTPPVTLEEPIMNTIATNPSVAIEVKTVVFGQDAATMTTEQLIEAVRKVEGAIDDLKKVKTHSKKIEKMIADQEAHLASLVAVLDEK